MNLWNTKRPGSRRGSPAFTMVEIALCLGVIAVALVAIVGVMPTGVQVQRDNQQETIMNQDGKLLLEAIRSGSEGLDYLTNHFVLIEISDSTGTTNKFRGMAPCDYLLNFNYRVTNGMRIIGLLSTPKLARLPGPGELYSTNTVTALVQSISGGAIDRSTNAQVRGSAFTYQLRSEITPLNVFPPDLTNFTAHSSDTNLWVTYSNNWAIARNQTANFYELRLTLQGPVIARGRGYRVGGTPNVFRALVTGQLRQVEDVDLGTNWLFKPEFFAKATP